MSLRRCLAELGQITRGLRELGMASTALDASLLPSTSRCSEAAESSWLRGQVRGYRSKRAAMGLRSKTNLPSLKPLNNRVSWEAVKPFLPEQQGLSMQDAKMKAAYEAAPILDSALPPIPQVPKPETYVRVGRITGQYRLATQPAFGIVELAGRQFKATADDVIFPDRLSGVEVNDVIRLDRVLLLGSRCSTIIGRPYIPGACVYAAVEEHFRDGKLWHYKFKRAKRYQRLYGHRQNKTTLRILEVRGIEEEPGMQSAQRAAIPIQPYAEAPAPRQIMVPGMQAEAEVVTEAVPPGAALAASVVSASRGAEPQQLALPGVAPGPQQQQVIASDTEPAAAAVAAGQLQ